MSNLLTMLTQPIEIVADSFVKSIGTAGSFTSEYAESWANAKYLRDAERTIHRAKELKRITGCDNAEDIIDTLTQAADLNNKIRNVMEDLYSNK